MATQLIQPWQNKRLHALLGPLKLTPEEKAGLVAGFGGDGVTSTKELSSIQAWALIRHLETAGGQAGTESQADVAERQRRKVISLAHELRWHLPGGKVDMAKVNAWCVAHGPEKKPLNAYPVKELAKLISQLVIVRDNFLKTL